MRRRAAELVFVTLDAQDDRIRAAHAALAPYARRLVDRAGDEALAIHADVVSVEHLLLAMMRDEDSAAHQVVLHAFADPETVALEALAIAPGLLVVASESTRAFSTRAVEALHAARRSAAAGGCTAVDVDAVLDCAVGALPEAAREALVTAGLRPLARAATEGAPGAPPGGAPDAERVRDEGPLFRSFSTEAKRLLSAANRLAAAERARELLPISPAHLVLAALKTPEVADRAGVSFASARGALTGRTKDPTPPPARRLPPDDDLGSFLQRLRPGSDSLDLLGGYHAGATPELSELLARHKVTAPLLERSRGAFTDPSTDEGKT